jgi:predicted transcriptional regulator
MKRKGIDLFVRKNVFKLMDVLESHTVSIQKVSRYSALSYVTTFYIIKELESRGILHLRVESRDNIATLTSKGNELLEYLRKINEILKN